MREAIRDLIGKRVYQRRVSLAMTQEEVARRAGVSRQALSEIERGTQAPRWETIYMIAEVLRYEVADLLPTCRQVRLVEAARRLL